MRYTPRQIAVRGREAAGLLVALLDREAFVIRFLRAYANDNNRPAIITEPILHRDLLGTVRREALLAMATHVDELAPRFLGLSEHPGKEPASAPGRTASKRSGKKTAAQKKGSAVAIEAIPKRGTEIARQLAAEAAALDLFRQEFFAALGQSQRWSQADFEEFSRDYDLYEVAGRQSSDSSGAAKGAASGPFVDRCGLLLDPSMLEQARRAAGKFETQLRAATLQAMKRVFAARREN